MPMRYANEADVISLLVSEGAPAPDNAELDHLRRVENGLADNFDEKCGTTFGVAPTPETRTVTMTGEYVMTGEWWYRADSVFFDGPMYRVRVEAPRNQIILGTRLRNVPVIETGGTWDGTEWIDGETLDSADYQLNYWTPEGYWGIVNTASDWEGYVRITGVWADQSSGVTVPADVREALTFLTIDQWRALHSSPQGVLGPADQQISIRNPWQYESVKQAINRHRVVKLIV